MKTKLLSLTLSILVAGLLALHPCQAQKTIKIRFDSNKEVSGKKFAIRVISPDIPANWDGFNFVVLEFRSTTPQRFQVGFTTDYLEARSSTYCTDVAKVTRSPVFHVNGDDVEALIFTVKMALEFRQHFHSDVFIDILSYRKYGHNEGDEPRFTQPLLYKGANFDKLRRTEVGIKKRFNLILRNLHLERELTQDRGIHLRIVLVECFSGFEVIDYMSVTSIRFSCCLYFGPSFGNLV